MHLSSTIARKQGLYLHKKNMVKNAPFSSVDNTYIPINDGKYSVRAVSRLTTMGKWSKMAQSPRHQVKPLEKKTSRGTRLECIMSYDNYLPHQKQCEIM